MEFLTEFEQAKVVESTLQTKESIGRAIEVIFSSSQREPSIFLLLDDIQNRAFICLYREPLEELGTEIIRLQRGSDMQWHPKDIMTPIDWQLAKLGRASQDSQ